MKFKRHQKLVILIFCAIMASLSIVLDKYLQIPLGFYKFTLYGLPLMFVGLMFGSIPGLIVGSISGIVIQITSEYGIGPTSIFWALAPIAWGGVAGLLSDLFKEKIIAFKIAIIVVSCSVSALLLNTLAMVMEGVLMNSDYYTMTVIITGLPTRIISSLILAVVYTVALSGLYFALHRYMRNLSINSEKHFDEALDEDIVEEIQEKEENQE